MGRSAAVTDFAEMVSAGGSRDFGLFLRALVEFVEHSLRRRVHGICLVADHERIIAPGTNAVCRSFSLRVLRTTHAALAFPVNVWGLPAADLRHDSQSDAHKQDCNPARNTRKPEINLPPCFTLRPRAQRWVRSTLLQI